MSERRLIDGRHRGEVGDEITVVTPTPPTGRSSAEQAVQPMDAKVGPKELRPITQACHAQDRWSIDADRGF